MRIRIALPVALCIALGGCDRSVDLPYTPQYAGVDTSPVRNTAYSFGIPPVGTIRSLWNRYSRLVSAINGFDDAPALKLESALTVEAFDRKIAAGSLDFAIVDPAKVLTAERYGYQVIARTGWRDRVRGVVIVASKSLIRRVVDLRGRSIAFSSPDDIDGAMLNELELLERGVNVRKHMRAIYVHSEESALMNVWLYRVDAAGVGERDWLEYKAANPEEADDLKVLLRTDDLSGPAVMASSAVPKDNAARLQHVLAKLGGSDAGLIALKRAKISEFTAAESASYDDVWEFLGEYRAKFGQIRGCAR